MNPRKHLIIPDSQVTQDTPTDHLRWIGNYIVEKQPDVILHIGDFADMESLSSYNVGKIQAEGTRYKRDLIASRNAMHDLLDPLEQYNEKRRLYKEKQYRPEMHLTLGNHENRITRYVENNPNMVGFMSVDDLEYESFGWKVHDFLKVVEIDGVAYSHYFYNPLSGRPYGGESIETRLKNLGFSFVQGHQQIYKVGTRCLNNGRRIRGLIQGSCLTPDHKVLTADLRYVELGSLSVGDKLISFDENVKGRLGRKYRTGSVDAIRRDVAECFAVTLDNGKVFKVTGDHLWLTRVGGQKSIDNGSTYMWRMTSELRVGTGIPIALDEWDTLSGYDAGYLAGIYDGEGSLYGRKTGSTGGSVMQLSFSQRPGVVFDQCAKIMENLLGYELLGNINQKGVLGIRIKGGAKNCAKVLGSIRPERLLEKFKPEWLGTLKTNMNSKVVSIEPIGLQEIVRIAIDEKTMIVEGYPHHNCYLHDEIYRGPQGNNEMRLIFMLHEVADGDYMLMEVSLDYLCRKYEGVRLWEFMKKKYPELFRQSTWMRKQREMELAA